MAAEAQGIAKGAPPLHLSGVRFPREPYRRALELTKAGKFMAAIPLFQRVLQCQTNANECDARLAYADCLCGAAFKSLDRLGVPGPQQSVSTARIEFLKPAAAQLDTAEQVAAGPRLI